MASKQYRILKENSLELEINTIYSIEEITKAYSKNMYDKICSYPFSETDYIQHLINAGIIELFEPFCSDGKTLADYLIDGNIIRTTSNKFGVIAGDYIYYVDGFDELSTFYQTGTAPSGTKIEEVYRNAFGWNFKVLSSKLPPTAGLELVWQATDFTEQENGILNALPSKYDTISRDANGKLSIESSIDHSFCSFHMYDHLFRSLLNSTSHKFR